ncbi:Predicted arabinose efflux permease, MFS family [Cupriavidus sp. OV038]|jgi:predicted MFS family arabinose efflux permease|uniref:MFS transporter n=1 Tax=unclassified Cupriavidus TaxID=2640874 RepID=UPI0008E12A66|nr:MULTISPECIES: MFS transporter [unclassified Cupriavidus]SFB90804.1 Predicted arabinose efflux permease, MFS family [Cupriavidus sp. OV038]SFO99538.1 Predicted arabinose efflux permease, MFS family [Cupriavidus sp. OV096]
MSRLASVRPALPILIGASVMLSLAMGLRQSLGIFVPPLTRDIGISVGDFTIAVAVQNLTWGVLQPFAGALAVRTGFRPLMVGGALLYLIGLVLLATSHGLWAVVLGAGVLIGMAMASTGTAMAMAAASSAVNVQVRSLVLGCVSACGSLGAMIAAPLGQSIASEWGWRMGVAAFVVLALVMLPAAWFAGRSDTSRQAPTRAQPELSGRQALMGALRHPPFVVMALAYTVCGMQLVFLTTHLPAYLDICGMDPMLSAKALGMIGGFNVLGSLFFGWAGGRVNKLLLLGGIYICRSLGFIWFFHTLPTPESTLVFSGVMGFLWLGVSPLVQGWIAQTFGLRWQAMIAGVAFFSHQIGSFIGAFGGGWLYDLMQNYSVAWKVGAALGLTVGLIQIAFALVPRAPSPDLVPSS